MVQIIHSVSFKSKNIVNSISTFNYITAMKQFQGNCFTKLEKKANLTLPLPINTKT